MTAHFFEKLLSAFGIQAQQPAWRLILSLLFILPPPKPAGYYQQFFPHIDFAHLRWGDLIRFPLQVFWLIIMRSPEGQRQQNRTVKGIFYAPFSPLIQFQNRLLNWLAQRLQLTTGADRRHIQSLSERYAANPIWDQPVLRYFAYSFSILLIFLSISTPFDTTAQFIFLIMLWLLALILQRIPGQVMTLLLMVLSVAASSRYLWWRVTSTLNWDSPLDLWWGLLLLAAEIYTWTILIFGYIQSGWPLKRPPLILPADSATWPTVDVFIPTYNEPLKVVKPTVFAAMELDWPKDKIRIHLLDDGRREEFRAFAAAINVNYITRNNNHHAKAGNLNHAMTVTDAEYISIFDCDHIPNRSFLQMGMGWFLADPKLALVQTPHHFYSADPFERNLNQFRTTPNEGELFYGVVQDGNDLWNATFFCGSCAIIRREPLAQVGGIAVETVTEDAHTALKLQRLGYNSAYINIPQAAGLATESLSAHIGQRIRWARGMAQIFRVDNPFLGKGLRWTQRLCYTNAMLHFFNGIPRIIFLTAPLAFLIFHSYIIYAPALSVALYVLPHMAHATLTNSRTQGEHRNSFWAEVYETVLAWYIARPTFVALLNPTAGKFNVTAKGGSVETEYFDQAIALPYLVLIGVNVLGIIFGCWFLIYNPANEVPTILLNMFWVLYNLVILGAAASVAFESKQVRLSHRVQMKMPAVLYLANGKCIRAETVDFSEGGIAILPATMPNVQAKDLLKLGLWRGEEEKVFPAQVIAIVKGQLRLNWLLDTPEQESDLVQCTFGRADAWINWNEGRAIDRPLHSLGNIMKIGLLGIRRLVEHSLPRLANITRHTDRYYNFISSYFPRSPTTVT